MKGLRSRISSGLRSGCRKELYPSIILKECKDNQSFLGFAPIFYGMTLVTDEFKAWRTPSLDYCSQIPNILCQFCFFCIDIVI